MLATKLKTSNSGNFIKIREVTDFDCSIGEACHNIQLSAHRLDVAAQSRQIHVSAFFNLGNGGLLDL